MVPQALDQLDQGRKAGERQLAGILWGGGVFVAKQLIADYSAISTL